MNKFTILILLLLPLLANAQIKLDNASFEGEIQDATTPPGWHPCEKGTTPDILPGPWGVRQEPFEGNSFVGLITRDDGTWESIGQRISEPLQASACYNFSLVLAHSKEYAGYNKAIKLRIWGGSTSCSKDQLLAETSYINHTEWKRYAFKFLPDRKINYIILEAQFMDGIYFFYRGNVLIDGCSTIDRCDRA